MLRIGMLTSGGDCQTLNAAMRGVVKCINASGKKFEVYGFMQGYQGLIYENYKILREDDFSGIINLGGTILGSSRTSFKQIREPGKDGINKVEAMKQTYHKLKLDCLVVLGGNGSHKTANLLREEGLNVVTLPKTIDNDLWGTDVTFGFHSAVEVATDCIDSIHTTAASHGRVFVVEVMGHHVGWVALYAGIAGGADVILIPEIPYDINNIISTIESRKNQGKNFTIIVVAEGAISKKNAALTKAEYKAKKKKSGFLSVSYEIADEIKNFTGMEIRVAVPGHIQRGGAPCPYDRILAGRLGAKAGQMILDEKYGYMVGFRNNEIISVPLGEVAGKLKYVPDNSQMLEDARALGICMGD